MSLSFSEINAEQKKGFDYKIKTAVDAIAEGFRVSAHTCAIAFSGGKDSTVLWHLIRTHFPDKEYKIIFGNTGVEFPESLAFARKLGKAWGGSNFYEARPAKTDKEGLKYQAQREVLQYLIDHGTVGTVLKADGKLKTTTALEQACPPELYEDFKRRNLIWPAGTIKNYWWCVDQYGYPILGKAKSKLTARRINIDCFLLFSETKSEKPDLIAYYDLLRKVKFSNHCCDVLKKEPSERLQEELNVDVVFKGLMASESRQRALNFSSRGYMFRSKRHYCGDFYHCNPLSIWTDDDIWEYIHRFGVPYSPLYDITYVDYSKLDSGDYQGCICKVARNGCIGCATDIAFKDNHLSILRQTHPALWKFFMERGLGKEIANLSTAKRKDKMQLSLFDLEDMGYVLERQPCAFDDVYEELERDSLTESEYDPEID